MLAERLASSHSNVTSKCHLSIVNTKCSYVNTYLGRPAASVDEGRFVEIDTHGGEEVKRAKVEKWPGRFSSHVWRGGGGAGADVPRPHARAATLAARDCPWRPVWACR